MGALGSKLRTLENGSVAFRCPGCGHAHQVRVDPAFGSAWSFNGNGNAPTFTPSILVRGKQLQLDGNGKWTGEWVRDASGNPVDVVCHSFVTEGRIQFLGDCTHALAGQAVDLPDWSFE